jgi:hypothetical protein
MIWSIVVAELPVTLVGTFIVKSDFRLLWHLIIVYDYFHLVGCLCSSLPLEWYICPSGLGSPRYLELFQVSGG